MSAHRSVEVRRLRGANIIIIWTTHSISYSLRGQHSVLWHVKFELYRMWGCVCERLGVFLRPPRDRSCVQMNGFWVAQTRTHHRCIERCILNLKTDNIKYKSTVYKAILWTDLRGTHSLTYTSHMRQIVWGFWRWRAVIDKSVVSGFNFHIWLNLFMGASIGLSWKSLTSWCYLRLRLCSGSEKNFYLIFNAEPHFCIKWRPEKIVYMPFLLVTCSIILLYE